MCAAGLLGRPHAAGEQAASCRRHQMDGGSRRKQARWRGGAAGQLGSSSLNAAAAGVAQLEREQLCCSWLQLICSDRAEMQQICSLLKRQQLEPGSWVAVGRNAAQTWLQQQPAPRLSLCNLVQPVHC